MLEQERPNVRRVPASGIHVAIKLDSASEHNLWADVTLDVTRGGVFVATFHPLSIGMPVHLLLTLDEETPLALSGVVHWIRPHRDGSDGAAGVGVRFVDLDPEAADKLACFASTVREPMIFEDDGAQRQAPSNNGARPADTARIA